MSIFKVVCFLCMFTCALSQGTVDPNDCVELSASHGTEVYCPTGFVAMGACGSGENADCNGDYIILKCCKVNAAKGSVDTTAACEGQQGSHGAMLECSEGMQMISLCGSGENDDCGQNIYAKVTCCDGNGITTDGESFCNWSNAGHGHFHECTPNEVMTGYCGSGRDENCDGYSTKIKCCTYR